MGTRADFYIGTDPSTMEYLGSIAYDGDEIGELAGNGKRADWTPDEFRAAARAFIGARNDGSLPERAGWPWPWEDSSISDCAYTVSEGRVLWARGPEGRERWYPYPSRQENQQAPHARFPNMRAIKRVTMGSRSGLICLAIPGHSPEEE